jgi:hypothetical protein
MTTAALYLLSAAALNSTLDRFPNQATCKYNLTFITEHREYLEAQRQIRLHQAEQITRMLVEVNHTYRAWYALDCAHYRGMCAKQYFEDLRDLIGESNYLLGFMPSPVFPWLMEN